MKLGVVLPWISIEQLDIVMFSAAFVFGYTRYNFQIDWSIMFSIKKKCNKRKERKMWNEKNIA